jgi:hypothetical protein
VLEPHCMLKKVELVTQDGWQNDDNS